MSIRAGVCTGSYRVSIGIPRQEYRRWPIAEAQSRANRLSDLLPTRIEELDGASRIFTSWNHAVAWLRRLQPLRMTALRRLLVMTTRRPTSESERIRDSREHGDPLLLQPGESFLVDLCDHMHQGIDDLRDLILDGCAEDDRDFIRSKLVVVGEPAREVRRGLLQRLL
jgi:hypothetical protein